jgi:hypothetical protein
MTMRFKPLIRAAAASLAALASSTQAGTVWNEAVNGDLSGAGANPTFVGLAAGTNDVFGASGDLGAGTDLDYFRITVPAGMQLSSLRVLAGTAPESLGFIGVQAGTQVTGFGASALLGWTHYGASDVGQEILQRMGGGAGAIGFTGALGAGHYAFWVQDFDSGSSAYAFQLTLTPVPEPAPVLTLLAGLVTLAWRRHPLR